MTTTLERLPDWLRAAREEALEAHRAEPGPSKGSEIWKRAAFSEFWAAPQAAAGPGDRLSPERGELAGVFRRTDGGFGADLDPDLKARGVVLSDLESAAALLPETVRPHLEADWGGPEERKLELANRAAWRGGAFLFVPRGVRVERPLRAVFEQGGPAFPRLLAVLEDGAEASLLEEQRAPSGASAAFTRVVLGAGARLRFALQQEAGPEARQFTHQQCLLGEGAELTHASLLLGARSHKSHLEVRLEGRRARSELFGLALGRAGQSFDFYSKQWHRAPQTYSDLLFRSALKEAARVVYNGLIRIEPGAQQTEAFQSDHNLLLSEKARADSTPILEILTDDVRCKHGATAGPVDPEELFYLLTRGFGRDEALRTLVLGFFEPVLRRIPSEEERERLGALLEERL